MTLWEFLSDRMGRIVLWLICAGLAALFLFATGTQPGILAILLIVLLLVFLIVDLPDLFYQRAPLLESENILDGLDRKYLFAECVPPLKGLYERRLFDKIGRAGQAMTGAVSDAQASQREYREYVGAGCTRSRHLSPPPGSSAGIWTGMSAGSSWRNWHRWRPM